MTDDFALEALREIAEHKEAIAVDPEAFGLDRLRAALALMGELTPLVGGLLHVADEKELAEARARVAEIESRLKVAPVVPPPRAESKPSPTSDYEQTDAGMGIGGGREPAQSADDFRDELHELRERGVEKRRKRGI